jgi:hypothetical protein
MHLRHVGVNGLEAEILLGLEVVVEGALWRLRRLEERGDSQVEVAMAQQHRHSLSEELLSGIGRHQIRIDRSV